MTWQYLPIFMMANKQTDNSQIEAEVKMLDLDLKYLCTKNHRAPAALELAGATAKSASHLTEVSFGPVEYLDGHCKSELNFKAKGAGPFVVPLPMVGAWTFPLIL